MTVVPLVRPGGVPVTPPTRPPSSGILDIATVIEGLSFLDPKGLIWSYNCVGVDVDEVACAQFKTLTKRFDTPSSSDGAMFAVQCGVRCKPFGFDGEDPALKAAFAAKEPEGVSIGLHDFVFDTAVDLTPATGAVTPAQALGLLEGVGYGEYVGQPVLHLGPMITSQLVALRALEKSGNHLETLLGTPVAVAMGAESKTAGKLDAEQWAFVTGAVVLARSEVQQGSQIDRTTNEITVLHERLYVAAVDCMNAKVKVKVL